MMFANPTIIGSDQFVWVHDLWKSSPCYSYVDICENVKYIFICVLRKDNDFQVLCNSHIA
jgi:hypothetical protein